MNTYPLEPFARLLCSCVPSATVHHLIRVAESARDMTATHVLRASSRQIQEEQEALAQHYDAIARALRLAEQATDRVLRLEGAALEVRVMRDRVHALGRTLVPPLDPRDVPPDFADAIAELDELGEHIARDLAESRKRTP